MNFLLKTSKIYVSNLKSLNNNTHYQSNFSLPLKNLNKRVEEKRIEKIFGCKCYFNKEHICMVLHSPNI